MLQTLEYSIWVWYYEVGREETRAHRKQALSFKKAKAFFRFIREELQSIAIKESFMFVKFYKTQLVKTPIFFSSFVVFEDVENQRSCRKYDLRKVTM